MFCKKCGTQLNPEARFCKKCGAATDQNPSVPPTETGAPPRISIGVAGEAANRKPILISVILVVIAIAAGFFWWIYKDRAISTAGNAGGSRPVVTFSGPSVETIIPKIVPFRTLNTSPASIAFSPDGQLLVAGMYNGEVEVRSVADGRRLSALNGHGQTAYKLAFSPDGQVLATGGSYDNTVRMWRVSDWSLLHTLVAGNTDRLVFSPDGATLETRDLDTVKHWRVSDGFQYHNEKRTEPVDVTGKWNYESPGKQTRALLIESNESDDNRQFIELRGTGGGQLLHKLTLLPKGFYRLQSSDAAFSPDGKMLLAIADGQLLDFYAGAVADQSIGLPSAINLWRISDARLLFEQRSPSSGPSCLAFSPDGRTFAVCRDGQIKMWRLRFE
jgi:WD40 repeat protein